MGEIIAVVNHKGGVGKSTTAVNLSAGLALEGRRVLLLDSDPQSNATSGIGLTDLGGAECMYEVIVDGTPLSSIIQPTQIAGLDVAPSSIQLAGAEIELVPAISRETRLRRAIEPVVDQYDYILIDCPPSLGLLTVNALTAANTLVIPIQCEYYALEGLSKLMETVKLVKMTLNPGLRIRGVLMTMHDPRTRLSSQVIEEVVKHFADKVFRTIIPRTVRLSEAPSFGLPIMLYDPMSKGSLAYQNLAKEVVRNGETRTW